MYYSIQHEANPPDIDLSNFQKTHDDLNEAFSQEGYQYLDILTLARGMAVLLAAEFVAYAGILLCSRKKPLQFGRSTYGKILFLSILWFYIFDVLSRKISGIVIMNIRSILLLIFIASLSYIGVFRKH